MRMGGIRQGWWRERLRPFLLIVLSGAIAMFVWGCGSSESEGGGGSEAGGAGNTLNVALNSGISTIDPAFACFPTYDYWVVKNTYDTLVQYGTKRDANGQAEIRPDLAKSWKISKDGLTYTFNLRHDVTFASGDPMTASDVVYGFQRLIAKGGCQEYVLTLGEPNAVESVKATGKYTVQFKIGKPSPIFLGQLTQTGLSPVDQKELEKHGGLSKAGDDWIATHSAGTGAYQVTEYHPDSQVVLTARDDYWQGKPGISRVVFQIVNDPSTLNTLIQSNQVDLAYGVPPKDVKSLEDSGRKLVSEPGPWFIYLGMNTKKAPFDDPDVRRAVKLSMNRTEMAEALGYGYAQPIEGPMPPTMPFRPDLPVTEQNVAEAKQLISKAGADGASVTIDVKAGDELENQVATVVQASLSEIGLDAHVSTLGASAFTGKVSGFDTQAYVIRDGTPFNDPAYFLGFFVKCENPFNWTQYCNPKVDELIAQGRYSLNPDVRKKAYGEISEIVAEEDPMVPLLGIEPLAVASPSLKGYVAYDDLQPVFWKMSIGE